MVHARKFVVARIFEGEIKESDLVIEEEELHPLDDGEYLVEAQYISVDPYMRAMGTTYQIGQLMIGDQVGKVVESKNDKCPVGTIVVGKLGWRTHTILSKTLSDSSTDLATRLYILPDIGDLPLSLAVGALGMPGNTAYFGFIDICKPKPGETVVVTGAAGAVGSHVGQLAKIKGCKVIGLTGSQAKAEWLKTLGFDHVINYKTTYNLKEALKEAAPNGIDIYFDNVGGETSSTIVSLMTLNGRISACGCISSYNSVERPKATVLQPFIARKCLDMTGFIVSQYVDRWFEGLHKNLEWFKEGKLKYKETITEGFENTTQALIGVLRGDNIGKAVVKVNASNVEHRSVDFKKLLTNFERRVK